MIALSPVIPGAYGVSCGDTWRPRRERLWRRRGAIRLCSQSPLPNVPQAAS